MKVIIIKICDCSIVVTTAVETHTIISTHTLSSSSKLSK